MDKKIEATAFAGGEGSDSSTATAVKPIPTRLNGVDAFTSKKKIP